MLNRRKAQRTFSLGTSARNEFCLPNKRSVNTRSDWECEWKRRKNSTNAKIRNRNRATQPKFFIDISRHKKRISDDLEEPEILGKPN